MAHRMWQVGATALWPDSARRCIPPVRKHRAQAWGSFPEHSCRQQYQAPVASRSNWPAQASCTAHEQPSFAHFTARSEHHMFPHTAQIGRSVHFSAGKQPNVYLVAPGSTMSTLSVCCCNTQPYSRLQACQRKRGQPPKRGNNRHRCGA